MTRVICGFIYPWSIDFVKRKIWIQIERSKRYGRQFTRNWKIWMPHVGWEFWRLQEPWPRNSSKPVFFMHINVWSSIEFIQINFLFAIILWQEFTQYSLWTNKNTQFFLCTLFHVNLINKKLKKKINFIKRFI